MSTPTRVKVSPGSKGTSRTQQMDEDAMLSTAIERRKSDLVDPYRPGALERLGIGPDVLLQRNPRLVLALTARTAPSDQAPLAAARTQPPLIDSIV